MSRKSKQGRGARASKRGVEAREESAVVIGPGLVLGLVGVALLAGMATLWGFSQRGSNPNQGLAPAVTGSSTTFDDAGSPSGAQTANTAPSIGRDDAPVTIVEFSDYQCPNCRQFALEVMPWLKENWIQQGFVRVEFRDFAVRGPASIAAAEAAHCAGDQGSYWPYHDALYGVAGGTAARKLEDATFIDLAATVSIDMDAFEACIESGRHRQRVEDSTAFATSQGFEGTPTYLINGRQTQGAINIADWDQLFRLYQQDFAQATQSSP